MQQGHIGRLVVSRLGYGCYAIGGAYGSRDPSAWGPMLRTAADMGISFFDTAESYGSAEEILGRELGPMRGQLVWSTKVGLDSQGKCDLSRERVVRACEASLRRLGTTWIDLYVVHFDDPGTPVAETVGALDELKASGKIREYGVGHLPPDRVEQYVRLGQPAAVFCELSPVARTAVHSLLPVAREHGITAVAFSPTGRGLLGGAIGPGHAFAVGDIRRLDPLFSPDKLASGLRIRDYLASIGRWHGKTAVQVGIAWVLAQPGVAAALTGPSSLDHLSENAGAAGWAIPQAEFESIDRFLAHEDERRVDAALKMCSTILSGPLSRQGDEAYGQLILAIETALEHGWSEESQVVPLVLRLMGVRKAQQSGYHPELEEIRRDVSAVVRLPGR